MIEAIQQLLRRTAQQFLHAQGRGELHHAFGILIVHGVDATFARHLLQHQPDRMFAIGSQHDARRQLLGLDEVIFQRVSQAGVLQLDQTLVTLTTIHVADGDRP